MYLRLIISVSVLSLFLTSCLTPSESKIPVSREVEKPLPPIHEPPTLNSVPEEAVATPPLSEPETPMVAVEPLIESETTVESYPSVEPEILAESETVAEPEAPSVVVEEIVPPPSRNEDLSEFQSQFGVCANIQDSIYRIIVKPFSVTELRHRGLSANAAQDRRATAISRLPTLRMTQLSYLPALDQYVFGISVTEDQEAIAYSLFRTGDYSIVRRDCVYRPALIPNDAEYGNQTYLPVIGAPDAWDISTGSSSVTIAVLDSGVDSTQEDLVGKVLPGFNTVSCAATAAAGCGTSTPVVTADNCRHHGTEVAAVAAATGNNTDGMAGISFGARILPIRITNSADCTSTAAEISEGIVWASEQGAKVINVSYAGAFDPTIQDASEQARRNGSLVVYAAGNNGLGSSLGGQDLYTTCLGFYSAAVCAAQTHPDVMIVGATDNLDNLANFSNYGTLVDIVAPGVGIRTSEIGDVYVDVDGTSFSAPIVAGAAALIWSVNPSLSPGDVQQILLESSLDLGTAGEDNSFGQGRLQLDQALIMAQLHTASTQFVDNAKLDFRIPRGPIKITTSDQVARSGAGSKLIVFTQQNPGLLSMEAADLAKRDMTVSEVPEGAVVGRSSLFYRRSDTSNDFVFTDNSRTRVYLGSTDAFGTSGSGDAVVNNKYCGPFSEITDIHLTTSATGTTSRLVVADRGAGRVYSYVLDPDGDDLCTSPLSVTLQGAEWIRSIAGANPRIYVGSRSNGLRVNAYVNNDFSAVGAQESITSSTTARFGQPLLDTQNNDLWVPVQFAYDSRGDDYVLRYTSAAYPPGGNPPAIVTCASPTQVLQDFEGNNRLTYFLCPSQKQVDVYDSSQTSLGRLILPFAPRKMIVGSNGVVRFLSFLRTDAKVSIYQTPIANPPEFSSAHISIPYVMDDIGTFGSLDQTLLVNGEQNSLTVIDPIAQSLTLTTTLPKSVDHMAPQSAFTNHFVSSQTNSAYTLEEVSNGVWKLRQYLVGSFPVQIGYRPNRLYTLNRSSHNLSVINIGTRAVSNLALGTRPVHFDFSASANRLWVANETSQNLTTVDISVGSEAVSATTALGFAPKKVLYQSSDDTLYVAGPTQVRALDGTTRATIVTRSLTAGVSDIDLITGGVWATSRLGVSASVINRSTFTTTTLTGSPHFLSSNGSVAVSGLMGIRTLTNSAAQSWQTSAFTSIFSNLTYLYTYNTGSYRLHIFPYSQMGSTTFPAASLPLLFDITRWASDSIGNLWTANSDQLRVQRVTSNLQLENIKNLSNNRPQDIAVYPSADRVYTIARNLNALFVYDTVNDQMRAYSVCQAPSKIVLDSTNDQIFILCQELNAISAVSLDAAGDPASQRILTTGLRPSDIDLNAATNSLYVSNRMSDTVSAYNTTNLSLAPASISVGRNPSALTVNSVTNRIHVFHESESVWSVINGTNNSVTETAINGHGFTKAGVNTDSAIPYAISPSPNTVFFGDTTLVYSVSGTNRLDRDSRPSDLAVSSAVEKIYITFENADTVRVFDEDAGTATDVATGGNPKRVFVSDSLNRVVVSNFDDDSLTVLNRTTNALVGTVTLTEGCGPKKASAVSVGGTDYFYIVCESNDTIERVNAASLAVQTPLSIRIP